MDTQQLQFDSAFAYHMLNEPNLLTFSYLELLHWRFLCVLTKFWALIVHVLEQVNKCNIIY
jgi:hypothetical protein